ncbi:MAG: hypothetical protein LLG04_06125 [Parachlamydia sp.]|nr:hypothetical protein [Parachlamydia sp.]
MKKMLALMLVAFTFTLTAEAIVAENCKPCCPPSPKCECDKPADPQFGYFYLTEEQCVEACFDTVSWENAGSVNTEGVFIDSSNADRIILKKKGFYLATYTLTGEAFLKKDGTVDTTSLQTQLENCFAKFQFALYLNEGDEPIPGSTYAGNTPFLPCISAPNGVSGESATEIVGQVIFRVIEKDSFIQLVNQSETSFLLDNEAGTCYPPKFGFNVSASIAIQRLSGLD